MSIRSVGSQVWDTLVENLGRVAGRVQEARPLAVDLYETDTTYIALFDAPGIAREDIQVAYEEDAIAVRMERFRDLREGYDMRFPGRGVQFEGAVPVPTDVPTDPKNATATLLDAGVLEVSIPKAEIISSDSSAFTDPAADRSSK